MKKIFSHRCYHLSILFGPLLLRVSSSGTNFTYPHRQLSKREQGSPKEEKRKEFIGTSDVRILNPGHKNDIVREIEDDNNTKQTSFIKLWRKCNKSNPAEYRVRKGITRGKCEKICIRKNWCLGYESNRRTNKCTLFNVTPNPAKYIKQVLCAVKIIENQASSLSASDRPSAQPSSIPSIIPTHPKWTFHVMSDLHLFTNFSWFNLEDNKKSLKWAEYKEVFTYIKDNFGGAELVILPGDQCSMGSTSLNQFTDRIGGNLSQKEAVYKALKNNTIAARTLFQEVGFDTVLATIGDHDIGGNTGFWSIGKPNSKILTHPAHRQGFGDGFNRNDVNDFIFNQTFGNILSRPMGTTYENTTFAYIHQNALFVTVDAFELVGDGSQDFIDRRNSLGGEGAVTCTVSGEHLTWFESILSYGEQSKHIKHIFVQAHLPIIQPVRIVNSSGQFFDSAQESDFWKIMNKYGVDVYFAGDVHSNTATKSTYNGSNLVQVVSRGNKVNNFLTVDITEDIIDIKIYNEYGEKIQFNTQYNQTGHLTIDKSSDIVTMSSSGMLELLDLESIIVAFDFEEVLPLGTRQVLAMRSKEEDKLIATEITIRDKLCKESFPNSGTFGAQYDAQATNIVSVKGRHKGNRAGLFDDQSRFGVYGSGPFGGGEIISFGLWFKTAEASLNMVLFHYASYWGERVYNFEKKDHITLALEKGNPVVNLQPIIKLEPNIKTNFADDQWHHIAISMPRKSCKASELEMYVDGVKINTSVRKDRVIFYHTAGRMSLGGFGYSSNGYEKTYTGRGAFIGALDDFTLHARPLVMKKDFPSLFTN